MRPQQYYNYNQQQQQHPHPQHPQHPQHKFSNSRSNPHQSNNNIIESSTTMERKSLAILEQQKTKISSTTHYANYNSKSNIKRNSQTLLPPRRTSSRSIDPAKRNNILQQRGSSWKQQQQQISSNNKGNNVGSISTSRFRSKTTTTTPARSKSAACCNLQSPRSVTTTTFDAGVEVEAVDDDAFPSTTPPVVSSYSRSSFPSSTPPIIPSPAAGIPRRSSSSSTRVNNDSKPERFQRSLQRKEQRSSGSRLGKKKIKPVDTRTSDLLLLNPSTTQPPTPIIRDYNDDLFDDIDDDDALNEDDDEDEEGEEVELGPGAYAVTSPSPDTFFVSPRRSSSFAAAQPPPPPPPPPLTATCTPTTAAPSIQRSNSTRDGGDYSNQMLDDSYSYLDDDDDELISSEDEDDECYGGSEEAELVVAAELSNDLEREIEERVRAQVMAEAAQATAVVVDVSNSSSLLPPRVPAQQVQQPPVSSVDIGSSSNKRSGGTGVHQRQLLPWKIEQEGATLKWVAIVQTNPNAKSLGIIERQQCERRFVAATKREAREIALAMATPRPLQQQQQSSQQQQQKSCCSLCQTNFSFFKRKKHTCINCGLIGLCQGCTTSWSKVMVPSTYYCSNTNNTSSDQSNVKICTVCDWSSRKFHQALLNGDIANARYLYKNHNVNLRNPYILEKNNKKKEVLYPIHAAILGGNLSLVKWLVVNRCCPLVSSSQQQLSSSSSQDFIIGNNGGGGGSAAAVASSGGVQPLLTSKGRSPVQLALNHLPILWYFVHDLKLNLMDDQLIKTVDPKLLLGHLTQIMVAGSYSSMMMMMSTSSSSNKNNKNKHNDDYDRKRKEKLLLLQQQQPKNNKSSLPSSVRRTASFSKASF